MSNPLFNQLQSNVPMNPMLKQFLEFKRSFHGNPQQAVQDMINSGRISQSQVNQYAQQANDLYRQLEKFM